MDTNTKPVEPGLVQPSFKLNEPEDLVELSLLVSKNRADMLIALAKKKNRTLGQFLRDLIDRELALATPR
jgi:hypothetical protein